MKAISLSALKNLARVMRRIYLKCVARIFLAHPQSGVVDYTQAPLVVAGLFRTASGIGYSAQLHAAKLKLQGYSPICVDLSQYFSQIDMEATHELSPMPASHNGTLVLHVNAPETVRALLHLRLFKPKAWLVVGVWHYELEAAPKWWAAEKEWLTEVWVPSRFVARAIGESTKTPTRIVPHEVDLKQYQCSAGRTSPETEVVFLTAADGRSSLKRKNPQGAIEAFKAAFDMHEKVRLIVKTRNVSGQDLVELRELIGNDERVTLVNTSLGQQEHHRLLNSCDIFVSLHRSEGYGLVIAETLALNKFVIATSYSGADEFSQNPNFQGVDFTLISIGNDSVYSRDNPSMFWADPDLTQAAYLMKLKARELTASN